MQTNNIINHINLPTGQKELFTHLKEEVHQKLPPGYEITELIGEGAIGSVYAVKNSVTNDLIAAKIVRSMLNVKIKNKIKQEFLIQQQLNHSNIGQVYGIGTTSSYVIIFMELFPEGDLFEMIPLNRGLNTLKGFRIYRQLLDAVDFCHMRHIVHLDIKPENIMIHLKEIPKIIDFGLAVDHTKIPVLKGHIGTSAYSAPETFLDGEYTGYKADIFSVNVTFLTMVTGERCWRQATLTDEHYQDWHEKKWTCRLPQRLPTDLLTFLIGALAYNPNDRFSIEQIKSHIWYRNALVNKIKAIKTHELSVSHSSVPLSQPLFLEDVMNKRLGSNDKIHDAPLSQPIDLEELIMPDTIGNKQSIVKRMTRFLSTQGFHQTVVNIINIIEQHQHCTILQRSFNHVTANCDLAGFTVSFRMFVYPLGQSILVDFRRFRGDGLLFHNLFMDIVHTAKELSLVNENSLVF